jgi:hypothetical protein
VVGLFTNSSILQNREKFNLNFKKKEGLTFEYLMGKDGRG